MKMLLVCTSPVIVAGFVLFVSFFCLFTIQNQTQDLFEKLAVETGSLAGHQVPLLNSHNYLKESISKLANDTHNQKRRLEDIGRNFREKNVVVYGIPEKDSEEVETLVRELFQEKLGATFGDYDIDEVKRFGTTVSWENHGKVQHGRKIRVRFLSYKHKFVVMNSTEKLKKTTYKIENDHQEA